MSDKIKVLSPDSAYMKLLIREMLDEYGVHDAVSLFAEATQEFANDMSDLGLKERAAQAASMAEVLRDINGD
jgi:hypothetical protein